MHLYQTQRKVNKTDVKVKEFLPRCVQTCWKSLRWHEKLEVVVIFWMAAETLKKKVCMCGGGEGGTSVRIFN